MIGTSPRIAPVAGFLQTKLGGGLRAVDVVVLISAGLTYFRGERNESY
jgi:hypothetical protein